MATPGRDPTAYVGRRFEEQPWRFELFQAVRLALRAKPALLAPGMHGLPAREAVRFYSSGSLCFPASIIESIEAVPPRKPAAASANPFHFVVAVLGLTGYSGVLPFFYSEFIQTSGAEALEEFLDLFNHRLISLEYRAWEKGRPQFALEREQHTAGLPLKKQFAALMGAPVDAIHSHRELPHEALLRAAGQFTQLPRSLVNLRSLLISNLGRDVEIDQFQGQWCRLAPSESAIVGNKISGSELGAGAVLGTKVWYQQASFRVRLPRLSFDEYLTILPGGRHFNELIEWVRSFTKGMYQHFEIELQLDKTVPMGHRIGPKNVESARLGWFGWLGSSDLHETVRRRVVFRSDERLAVVREFVYSALATVRDALWSERKVRFEWDEEVIQTLIHSNTLGSTDSGATTIRIVETLNVIAQTAMADAPRPLMRITLSAPQRCICCEVA